MCTHLAELEFFFSLSLCFSLFESVLFFRTGVSEYV